MKGKVIHYRRGRKTQYKYQMIVQAENVEDADKAKELLGKGVVFKTESGKQIKGEITRIHGKKGRVVARFERGLPGQAIGGTINIQ